MSRDMIVGVIFVFSLAIAFFVLYTPLNTVFDTLISNEQINQSDQAVAAFEGSKAVTNQFDYVVFGVFIAIVLSIIITGWFIGGYPIFMFIYFIFILISIIVSAVLAYVWDTIAGASIFGTTAAAFPITNHLISNLPIYTAVIGFIGVVVMFAKPYFSDQE